MRHCVRCVLPDTRPNLTLDASGACNACRTHGLRPAVDWDARRAAFARVAERAKSRGAEFDCLVPVSGGKDSHWQILTCLEHGLRPLAYTWRPPGRTPIGQRNLDNLIGLGVHHLDLTVNPAAEKRFLLKAFERLGNTAVPMHMGLYSTPRKLAVAFGIPLIVWGENSAYEYGSDEEAHQGFAVTDEWIRRYGVTGGTTIHDWIGDGLTSRDLAPYIGPDDATLAAAGVSGVFLGYYFPWDPEATRRAAEAAGFAAATGPRTGLYAYADIDDDFISIHHWLKWYKFGFTRLQDNLSLEIRNGRITRQQALETIARAGDQTPHEDIDSFCAYVGISRERFMEIAETFRNHDIWTRRNGTWMLTDFLLPDWEWS